MKKYIKTLHYNQFTVKKISYGKIKFLILYAIAFWVQAIIVVALSFTIIGPRPIGLITFGTVMSFGTSYKIANAFLSKKKDTE